MRLRYIIECEHAPAELEEEVSAERHKGPEGELYDSKALLVCK